MSNFELSGYLRKGGRKGIRNVVIVVYLVECAHHVAREIALQFRHEPLHLIGFGGCYPNEYADKMMNALCVHPNVGAVLLISLGCESFNGRRLQKNIGDSGRPVKLITIQKVGGTRKAIMDGSDFVRYALEEIKNVPVVKMGIGELIIGTVCGGSDATSGITANPAVGLAFDKIVRAGGTAIFEETGEMVGLEHIIEQRAAFPELSGELRKSVEKAVIYYAKMGHGSFAAGNADGGLTTIEEKSMGAYSKSGESSISGLLKPGDIPPGPGLYLLDVVPDGEPKFGFPNINDTAEIVELIASGSHCILFTTGRGSVVGSAIAPVIKICANPETFARMQDDMDVNAGRVLNNEATLDEIGDEIVSKIMLVAGGEQSRSESLGHQEFVLGYKTFVAAGPSCLPSH